MSLENVYYWDDDSWKKITAEEFVKNNPDIKVAAKAKIFWCETCGQYVILANGENNKAHFKHSSAEEIKNCDDRTQNLSKNSWLNSHNPTHNLPIKILVEDDNFYFQIGLIQLPHKLFEDAKNCRITIQIAEQILNRSDLSDYIIEERITWLDVGSFPAKFYSLKFEPKISGINFYWAEKISGINSQGTVFDYSTGKKIFYDADVKVNSKYFLLTDEEIFFPPKSVKVKFLMDKHISAGKNYFLYEVEAQELSEEAAKFFLKYHCRLTAKPVSIQPIYPVFTQADDIIHCNAPKMFFYFSGNAETRFFPSVRNSFLIQEKDLQIIEAEIIERPQMLAVGRLQLLQYLYLRKNLPTQEIELPKVEVKDLNNKTIKSGIYSKLPKNSTLQIYAEFDCQIIITKKNITTKKFFRKGEDFFVVKEINFDTEIKILCGLDCMWSAVFEREEKGNTQNDAELFLKLERGKGKQIKIPHTWGNFASRLKNFPQVKNWLYRSIRTGFVSEEAYFLFRKFILNF